ncbi:uncharacterized protein [Ptychodera flava]|uniref:uncharacterized protein n=1 Tax=Ptychodera flava TaxID=63121 RepID=UPI003969D5C4
MSSGFRTDRQVITGLARQNTINRCIPAVNDDEGYHHLCNSLKPTQLITNQSIKSHGGSSYRRLPTCPTVVTIDRTYPTLRDQTRRSRQALPPPGKLKWSAGSNRSRARVREPGEPFVIAPLNVELAPTKLEKDEDITDTGRLVRPHKWMHEPNYWPGIVKVSHEYTNDEAGLTSRQSSRGNDVVPWVRTYKVKQNRNTVRRILSRSGDSETSASPLSNV